MTGTAARKHPIVIRRDKTFEVDGRKYAIIGGGPGTPNAAWGYEIVDVETGWSVDGFFTYDDIRDHVSEAIENGWDIVSDDGER